MDFEAVSINGQIFSPKEASIPAVDQGLMFAHGVFETFRVSGGKVFLLDQHFTRMDKNLKALNINWTYDPHKHLDWVKQLSAKIPDNKDGRLRFCVTSGADNIGPNVVMYLSLIDKFKPSEKTVQILKSIARHKPEYFNLTGFRVKSLEYSYLYIAKKELEDGADDGILLSPSGQIAEALTSNIFWVKDGKIYTPPLSLGILAGTMRDWLMQVNPVEEKLADRQELIDADEIFLSAGASYLTSVSSIDGIKKPGLGGDNYNQLCKILADHLADNQAEL